MTENEKKIGKKYVSRFNNDNNIYTISSIAENEGIQSFVLGPGMRTNQTTKKSTVITCQCDDFDDLYEEFIE